MAAGGILQGTFGFAKIGGTVILLRPGASLAMPINPDIPAPINGYGGYGAVNYEQGLQFPQLNLPCVPLDTGVSNWFSAANLNSWFFTRSSRPVWDLSAATVIFADSGSFGNAQGIQTINGAKGGGFTLSVRKGQGISMQLRFSGTSVTPAADGTAQPSTGLAGVPLSFNRIGLGTALNAKGVTGLSLQFDPGVTPNMELDGTFNPVEQNAGTPSCTFSLEMNALDTIAPPGWDPVANKPIELTNVTFTILAVDTGGGADVTLTFTLQRLRIRDPRNRQGTAGRVGRSFSYDCLATTSSQPLVIS